MKDPKDAEAMMNAPLKIIARLMLNDGLASVLARRAVSARWINECQDNQRIEERFAHKVRMSL